MKWSNAQYTWFLVYLTETIIVHTLQDVKTSNNCSLSLQAPIIMWSDHKCAGDDSPHSWKQIILQTSTLVTTEEPHRCYSDNHLHFFIRLLLYSFRGGEIFWSMTCWSALSESHCNPFHSRHCQMPMNGSPASWSALSSSRISYLPQFYGSRLCVVREVRGLTIRSIRWSICGEVNSPVVCWIRCSNESLRCKFYFLLLQWLFCIAD